MQKTLFFDLYFTLIVPAVIPGRNEWDYLGMERLCRNRGTLRAGGFRRDRNAPLPDRGNRPLGKSVAFG